MTSRAARAAVFLLAVATVTAIAPQAADAHPYLVRAEPAPGSSLAAPPKELRLLFTERLDGPYCTVTVVGPGSTRHGTDVQVSGTSLVATVGDLGRGAYTVDWSVIGDDGHRVEGEYGLAVGHGSSATASAVAGHASTQATSRALRALLVALDVALAAVVLAVAFFGSPDESRSSRSIFGMRTVWVAAVGGASLAVAQLWAGHHTGSVWSTVTGRLALQRLLATLALFPAVFGLIRRPWLQRAYAAVAVGGLLVSVALASHAFGASTGRTAQVAVLTVHLAAASVWLAALVAVLTGVPARRLAIPVTVSIAVVVGTGLFNTHVQLGAAQDLLSSAYGRVLDVKVAVVVLMIAFGVVAVRRRWEAAAGAGVLVLAGVLGQLPNPIAIPAFSQRHPLPAGTTVATTSTGSTLVSVVLSPGRPGLNRVVVSLQRPDADDVPLPVPGVGAVDAAATCACGAPPARARLVPVDGSPSAAGTLWLPRVATWTLRLATADGAAVADVDVARPMGRDEVVVGVPADLSGPEANACQDEVLGLQVAAAEVNERGVAGGRAVRVVAVDSHGRDPGASVVALRSLGARILATPCGTPDTVAAIQRGAAAARIPVIGGDIGPSPWTWPTVPTPSVEGRALARQVVRQGGRHPLVVVGAGSRQQAVATQAVAALRNAGLPASTLPVGEPGATAARIKAADPDVVVFSLSAGEAPALLRALPAVDPDWGPNHGALGSTSMLSATAVSTGGDWFKEGRVSLAGEVSPSDGSSLDYATRLQQAFPGRHPSMDGVRGYTAGWLIGNVLHRTPDASPAAVRDVLSHQLRSFVFGPVRLRWDGADPGAQSVAFFRTVFTNPLALAGLPGQVGHAGVFLGQGAFVQVTPWSDQ